ncbi:tetratricopeptide repeat protein [Kocuria sp. LHG3120]|uniref:tetratricopeptide repeat protein n=1 Tax=Kocuria sp. LHG3120 TaxID=2804590 RepID=UPI003CF222F6
MHRLALAAWAHGDRDGAQALAEYAWGLFPIGSSLGRVVPQVETAFTLAGIATERTAHSEATHWLERAVRLLDRAPECPMRARWLVEARTRLGETRRLAADYDEAKCTLHLALEMAETHHLNLTSRAAVHNCLGILAKDTGRYKEAAEHYQEALQMLTAELGAEDAALAGVYHNLAGLAHIQGRYTEAESAIRTALTLRVRSASSDAVGVAADTSVLGAVLAGQGRLDDAEAALHDAQRLWESLHGSEHYEIAVVVHNLADIHRQRGHLSAAHSAYVQALRLKEAVLNLDHPEIAALHHNIAALLEQQQRPAEALEHYDRALAVFHATVGEDHPNAQVCAANRNHLIAATPNY